MSSDGASEVDSGAIGGAKVGGDIDTGAFGGVEMNLFVDGDDGIIRHTGTDGTKNAQRDALRTHGKDVSFASEREFAVAHIKNAHHWQVAFGNDVVAAEIDSDIVIDEDVVFDNNVIAKGDSRLVLAESDEKFIKITDFALFVTLMATGLARLRAGDRNGRWSKFWEFGAFMEETGLSGLRELSRFESFWGFGWFDARRYSAPSSCKKWERWHRKGRLGGYLTRF